VLGALAERQNQIRQALGRPPEEGA
jgi:hypothetical protein